MTTATDWDVRDAETGPLRVTDVRARLARTAPTPYERKLEEHIERLGRENTSLRKQLDGWVPTRDWRTIRGVADLTPSQQRSALVAPTVEALRGPDEQKRPGAHLAAELVSGVDRKPGWPVWLDKLHLADSIDAQRWAPLHAMLDESLARTGPGPSEWAQEPQSPTIADDPLPVSPEGQAFLDQGPAPEPEPRTPWWRRLKKRARSLSDYSDLIAGVAVGVAVVVAVGVTIWLTGGA